MVLALLVAPLQTMADQEPPEDVLIDPTCDAAGFSLLGGCPGWTAFHDRDGTTSYPRSVAANSVASFLAGYDYEYFCCIRPYLDAFDIDDGSLLWSADVRGSLAVTGHIWPTAVAADETRVFVAGSVEDQEGGWHDPAFLAAFDADSGSLLWSQLYEGSGGEVDVGAIEVDGDLVFMAGDEELPEYDSCHESVAFVAAFSTSSGANEWSTTHEQCNRGFRAEGVTVVGNDVFMTGQDCPYYCPAWDANVRAFIASFDRNTGQSGWTYLSSYYGNYDLHDVGVDIASDSSQLYLVIERIERAPPDYDRVSTARIIAFTAISGVTVWERTVEGVDDRLSPHGIVADAGFVYVTGRDVGRKAYTSTESWAMALVSTDGSLAWDRIFAGSGPFFFVEGIDLAPTKLVLAGRSCRPDACTATEGTVTTLDRGLAYEALGPPPSLP
ncbi:MAG: PQQ-binding-like beta-propeller repeat protein [Thermoplasmatota archaeon]